MASFGKLMTSIKMVVDGTCKAVTAHHGNNACFDYAEYWNMFPFQRYSSIVTAEQCQERCKGKSKCQYWYWSGNSRLCFLQADSSNKEKVTLAKNPNARGRVSGPKYCPGSLGSVSNDLSFLVQWLNSNPAPGSLPGGGTAAVSCCWGVL